MPLNRDNIYCAVRVKVACGGIAQLVEHLPCKQGVSGSIPLVSTKYIEV